MFPVYTLGSLNTDKTPSPWPQARWVRARPGNKELLPPDLFVLVEAGFGSMMLDPSS